MTTTNDIQPITDAKVILEIIRKRNERMMEQRAAAEAEAKALEVELEADMAYHETMDSLQTLLSFQARQIAAQQGLDPYMVRLHDRDPFHHFNLGYEGFPSNLGIEIVEYDDVLQEMTDYFAGIADGSLAATVYESLVADFHLQIAEASGRK